MFFHLRENVKMKVYYECTSHISPSGTSLSTLNQVESVQSNCMWWSCWFGASALCEAISDTEINGIFKLCDRVFVQAPGLRAAGVTCRGRGTSSLWPTLLLSWGIGWLPCPLCTQVRGYWVNVTETCLHMTFFMMSQPFFIKSSENYRNLMGLILLNAYGIKRFFFPVDNSPQVQWLRKTSVHTTRFSCWPYWEAWPSSSSVCSAFCFITAGLCHSQFVKYLYIFSIKAVP